MQLTSGEGSAPSARIFIKRRLQLISVLGDLKAVDWCATES
jgi:hypothetical protein